MQDPATFMTDCKLLKRCPPAEFFYRLKDVNFDLTLPFTSNKDFCNIHLAVLKRINVLTCALGCKVNKRVLNFKLHLKIMFKK